jgi:hypothetical protein
MILSVTERYRFWTNVNPRLPCVTDRDRSVTKRYRTLQSVTYGIYGFWRI